MEAKDICKWYNICPMKRYLEEGELDKKWVEEYCWGNYQHCVRRKMEEESQYHPDNMLPNGTINKKVECQTAEVFYQDPTTKIIKKGFGSSDCKCLTHLFFIKDKKKTEKILKEIGFSVFYSFQNLYF